MIRILEAGYPVKHYVSRKDVPRKKGKKLFELDLLWRMRFLFNNIMCSLAAPIGIRWDGASVPRPAWSIIGLTPGCESDIYSLPHDLYFRTEGLRKWHGQEGVPPLITTGKKTFTIEECNQIMKALMEYSGEFRVLQIRLAYRIVNSPIGKKYFGGPAPNFG